MVLARCIPIQLCHDKELAHKPIWFADWLCTDCADCYVSFYLLELRFCQLATMEGSTDVIFSILRLSCSLFGKEVLNYWIYWSHSFEIPFPFSSNHGETRWRLASDSDFSGNEMVPGNASGQGCSTYLFPTDLCCRQGLCIFERNRCNNDTLNCPAGLQRMHYHQSTVHENSNDLLN